jgi:Leucine-rich repeat (LRR) protein
MAMWVCVSRMFQTRYLFHFLMRAVVLLLCIAQVSHKLSKLSLYDFDLSFNSMHVMPDIFDRMINLKKLNFEGNKIGVISPSVGNCKSLSDFTVSKNRLRSLSSAVAGLGELTRLRISDCAVRDVPDDLSGMACLQVLELERNELEVLPKYRPSPRLQSLPVSFTAQAHPSVPYFSPPEDGRHHLPCNLQEYLTYFRALVPNAGAYVRFPTFKHSASSQILSRKFHRMWMDFQQ